MPRGPACSRPGLDPHEAAKLLLRTVMGASIAELRSDKCYRKEPTGSHALMRRFSR